MSTPRTRRHARERVEVEPERVRSGRLGGVPPQLADPSEAVAGLDALHVGEHLGRDIQVRIEDRLLDRQGYGYPRGALGRHGRARRRVGGAAFLRRRGFFSDSVLGDFTKLSWGNRRDCQNHRE